MHTRLVCWQHGRPCSRITIDVTLMISRVVALWVRGEFWLGGIATHLKMRL